VEHAGGYLIQSVVFFGAAVLAVVASHRLGLGSVAGYLFAGIAIGPFGLKLVDRIEDVRQLAEYARGYEDTEAFLAEVALLTELAAETVGEGAGQDEKMVLSSVHQAKGLEWRAVFLVWLADGRFPSAQALRDRDGEEEERRLGGERARHLDELLLAEGEAAGRHEGQGLEAHGGQRALGAREIGAHPPPRPGQGEGGAEEAVEDQQRQGRPDADRPAHLDDHVDLQDRQDQEEDHEHEPHGRDHR